MGARRRMFGGMRFLLVGLLTIPLAAAACGSTKALPPPGPKQGGGADVSAQTVSSTRLILHGRVRCTAAVTTPVQAGQPLDVTFAVRNVSSRAVNVSLAPWGFWFVVRSSSGTTYDTRRLTPFSVPYIPPTKIRPGETKTVHGIPARVRWSGPLRITPGCDISPLPAVRVAVTAPGAPRDGRAAIADVVAAAGHLLDRCRPDRPGVAVVGRIYPPSGNAPPLHARCSIAIHPERGFDVADVLIVTPSSLRDARVVQSYASVVVRRHPGTYEAIAWEFVVTGGRAISVASSMQDASRTGRGMAPDWTWTGSQWQGPGGSRCGGSGSAYGPGGPDVEFISVCR
jgi:hypothetical protein